MQLLAIACLSLAAKVEEIEVPLCLDLQVNIVPIVLEELIENEWNEKFGNVLNLLLWFF